MSSIQYLVDWFTALFLILVASLGKYTGKLVISAEQSSETYSRTTTGCALGERFLTLTCTLYYLWPGPPIANQLNRVMTEVLCYIEKTSSVHLYEDINDDLG